MSVVLARGSSRFSGETDDYPPDITRHTKKTRKEKKSYSSSRSIDGPTIAEPYPKGSLLAPLLNPLHKAIYDTTVAVSRAPGDLLSGITPGERADRNSKSRTLRESDEDSDSEEYTESEEESEDEDPVRARQKRFERDVAASHRKAEKDLKAFHKKVASDREAFRALAEGRRAERESRREERRDERRSRREERRGKKHRKEKESAGEVDTGRFRLVICYWDGQREVF